MSLHLSIWHMWCWLILIIIIHIIYMWSVGQQVEVDNRIFGTNNFIELIEKNRSQELLKGVDAQVRSWHLKTRLTRRIHWRCGLPSGFQWQDGKGQAILRRDGPCGGEGQARGLAPRDQIRWWRASEGLAMMDRERPVEAMSSPHQSFEKVSWSGWHPSRSRMKMEQRHS